MNNSTYSQSDLGLLKSKLIQQTRPGAYQYHRPTPECPTCFPNDAFVRPQFSGAPLKSSYAPVEVESDIRGLDRPGNRIRTSGHHHISTSAVSQNTSFAEEPFSNFGTQTTRLDLPPIMMRGRGVNRWEHLPSNPQAHVMPPMDLNTSSRIVAKDQYRPSGSYLPGTSEGFSDVGQAIPTLGKMNQGCNGGQCMNNWEAGIVHQEPCTGPSCGN